ncbi:MAG TPA: tRNA uridine-5-carboxymethylaminomethyl(34) synthesis GTPase MnmE [Caulobacteraceae bacterium]|nr:tRNA uridine-5-carboxymethylaminomethyl(34) synthesis GTPase MnmE [Caulobacteraceae bacterium]
MSDTIFALATAPGRAAVAVIRLSGPGTRAALAALGGRAARPRRASLRTLRDAGGAPLDRALTLFFPSPRSYTGEDCAELHLHGGAGVVDAVTRALLALGLRLAEPGEFTRRAFENGKLDLDQAEAVADLVEAESAAQARQALGQLAGALGARYETWRERLIDALAQLEAAVDFPDEEIPADVTAKAREGLRSLAAELDRAVADEARGRRVREGYRVAVVGAPNAGKSSLINALLGRDAAIVAAEPGTTRDIIEAPLIIDGFKVLLADTAGLRAPAGAVEAEGVRRARAWAAGADLRLWVADRSGRTAAWKQAVGAVVAGDICVLNKTDLEEGPDGPDIRGAAADLGLAVLSVSLRNEGARGVWEGLSLRVRTDLAGSDFPAATAGRHAALLHEARDHLRRAVDALDEPELAAEDARLAARALARISGRIDADDILGRVFATFCIGK